MATMYQPYKTKTNENIAERRIQPTAENMPAKNSVDNSSSIIYNGNKGINTPVTDLTKQWKEKNQKLLKYAGDSAKKSINAGLKEAPDYMRDADEGTSFEKVQTASVKRSLAKDANDDKLYKSSIMEMIGHLSKENKEPYLKHAQPLQKYIDVKDEFDYKHNNYTTTENVDKTPDENVRQLQKKLNEAGYTDKFGQKLKEDGIYAGKTAYADDKRRADNPNMDKSYGYSNNPQENKKRFSVGALSEDDIRKIGKYVYRDGYNPDVVALKITDDGMVEIPQATVNASGPMGPMYEPVNNILNNDNNVKFASVTGTSNQGVLESVGGLKSNHLTSDGGNISPGDENRNPLKQTMIKCLSANWFRNDGNKENQTKIENQADKYRDFDDNSFTKAVYMNKSDGVKIFGHTGIMLINEDGFALVFSIYKDDAEMRFSVLTPNQVKRVLEDDGYIFSMSSSDGGVKTEYYDRFATFDINNGQGYNMHHHAVNIYNNPGDYGLFYRQCDDIACEILGKGGIDIKSRLWPNRTYDKIDDDTKSKNKRNSDI